MFARLVLFSRLFMLARFVMFVRFVVMLIRLRFIRSNLWFNYKSVVTNCFDFLVSNGLNKYSMSMIQYEVTVMGCEEVSVLAHVD